MQKKDKQVVNNGITFTGLLTVLFIALKLIGIIDCSWWWVLSPLWIELAIVVAVLVVIAIVAVAQVMLEGKKTKRGRRKKAQVVDEWKE